MSADNRICLMEMEWGWAGWHGSCSMDYFEPPGSYKEFDSKEKALKWAQDEAENIVILEGGITIVGIEEQTVALKNNISFCQERLDNIEKYGTQFPVNNDLNFR